MLPTELVVCVKNNLNNLNYSKLLELLEISWIYTESLNNAENGWVISSLWVGKLAKGQSGTIEAKPGCLYNSCNLR